MNKIIATFFGLGYAPFAQATIGSFAGLLVYYYLLSTLNIFTTLSIVFFTLIIGIYSSSKIEEEYEKDPSCIIIDEVVGMWVSLLFLPKDLNLFLFGFLLFRIFDYYKPLYIKKLESLEKGVGIMLDDVIAGFYTNIILQILFYFGNTLTH